jgi:fermentation-respiration switch protein FrsA (DUF1100 family)
MRRDIEFPAGGNTLRGWLYTPDDSAGPFPTVVAAHGFSCVKEQSLDIVGENISARGIAVLVYDHPNFGASDGLPRLHIDPWEQIHGYRYAISYAQSLDEVDSKRIGVWGTSYSGAHVSVLAAVDQRVKAAAMQVPMFAGRPNIQRLNETMHNWYPLLDMLDEDRDRWARGEAPGMIPVCADDPAKPHAFPGLRTYEFFHGFGDTPWKNECTIRSLDLCLEYDPTPYLTHIDTTPVLMVIAESDLTTPTDLSLDAYNLIRGPKELVVMPGDHYTSYIEGIDIASNAAADFFARQLTRKMGMESLRTPATV